jgi:succinate dehydrogenase / fumarate reductase membrane anchor subunit
MSGSKRNGVREWIFQRVSNLAIIIAGAFYIISVLTMDTVSYDQFVAFHSQAWLKVVASIVMVLAMANALLAGWQIGTDYTQKVKIPGFGPLFHLFYTVGSAAFAAFALYILWGI